jgi:hypothetical protein
LASKKYEEREVGRDARTGHFIPVEVADRRKATAVVETIRYPKIAVRLPRRGDGEPHANRRPCLLQRRRRNGLGP